MASVKQTALRRLSSNTRADGRIVPRLYLRDDLEAAVRCGESGSPRSDEEVFKILSAVEGQVYRRSAGRRTSRVVIGGRSYFAKVHEGVGWREIAKNLLAGKRPVIGARHEYEANLRLGAHGVAVPALAAFGERGANPARRHSFAICDALDGYASLEDVGLGWLGGAPDVKLKRTLLTEAGRLTAAMHAAGVCHRDYYACHLMANTAKLAHAEVELAIIDLHRAQVYRRLPRRARIRDLGALMYSASALRLTRGDRMRFVAAYAGSRAGVEMRRRGEFWRAVVRRAERLHGRAVDGGLATGDGALVGSGVASIGRLADLGRDPPLPFRFDVDLGGGAVRAVCDTVFRIQPGRRLVLRAAVEGRELILKAFFGRRGDRDWAREQRGAKALEASGVATPKVLGAGRGGGARLVAFEALDGSRAPAAGDVGELLDILGQLHRHGIRQRDLHLGNFLVTGTGVFAIDGANVKVSKTVSAARRLADIARLLAHFRSQDLGPAVGLMGTYEEATGAALPKHANARLDARVARARRHRIARFLDKTERDCTEFAVRKEAGRLVVVARGDDDPHLAAIVADPEAAASRGEVLKRGNTASAFRCGAFVVKRYNVTSRWHRRRIRLRASRARRAWRAGHGLAFAGLSTPRPRALIEMTRPGVGEAAAFLVVDHVEGARLDEAAERAPADPVLLAKLAGMFQVWGELRFVHADTKASNFVVNDGTVFVLDLDAAKFCSGRWWNFARRHRRDRARFLANWTDVPPSLREAIGERA